MGVRSGSNHTLITSLGVVVLMGFICFLLVANIVANRATKTATITTIPSTTNSDVLKLIGTKRPAVYYVSKRRVPNGPDPIHNRKTAVKFRQPPGQV
ncbi:CLAVATA3/ESR (CLE)-related protein 25 [Cornus florida]|uniref:CLAVATA3/ESR (CLE)-related protein 25 n=1 Tax=Cornus florida TaxID=4283 RepID=UPI00289EC0B7|nr:CLAVATA3/ESR (CLE)-related protein 25 [Cornus florida]